jgi:hypothetical protein
MTVAGHCHIRWRRAGGVLFSVMAAKGARRPARRFARAFEDRVVVVGPRAIAEAARDMARRESTNSSGLVVFVKQQRPAACLCYGWHLGVQQG